VIVDTNVYLSRWPFRRLRGDDPAQLTSLLGERGATQAWAGSFDGILHKDIGSVNSRLAADCGNYGRGFLVPFGTVNPSLPDWKDDLRRCQEDHSMPGIRLHPNYHGYDLKDPIFAELLDAAAARGLIVQIAWCMEDQRTQHPLLRVPNVDLAPLLELVRRIPRLRLVVLNWRTVLAGDARMAADAGSVQKLWSPCAGSQSLTPDLARQLADAGEVYFDFAMLEGPGGVERLSRAVPGKRVIFGSYFPFYCFESAVLKVRESVLTTEERQAVLAGNARQLLGAY
jgi:predicted TIM-barrel fold metal-dependent hydrolase